MRSTDRRCDRCKRAMLPREDRVRDGEEMVCPTCKHNPNVRRNMNQQQVATRHQAHEIEGDVPAHCPFCGSGGIIGSPSGTISCDFCKRRFTVRMQPQYDAMPQSIEGEPVGDAVPPQDRVQEGAEEPQEGAEDEQGPGADTEDLGDLDDDEDIPLDALRGQQATSGLYATASGSLLTEEHYLQHLAIAHADDPETVLAQVRSANRRARH